MRSAELERVVDFYETIDPVTLPARLALVYAGDASFKDPFNEVRGLAAIEHIFAHMFEQVEAPRFVVITSVQQGGDAFLTWQFRFRMKRFSAAPQCIVGASQLVFDAAGMVQSHRDYWDPAEELYEKLPLLGALMRMLKKAAAS